MQKPYAIYYFMSLICGKIINIGTKLSSFKLMNLKCVIFVIYHAFKARDVTHWISIMPFST